MAVANVYATHRECALSSIAAFSYSRSKRRAKAEALMGSIATECVWLQTCNRFELFLAIGEECTGDDLINVLEIIFGKDAGQLSIRYDKAAVDHLFDVAAMLDSMIVGEQQILGQIKAAVMEAEDLGMMGPELRPLFARAIRAGRRARTETAISAGNVSMASVAVSLAEECVGTLLDAECMVIGAGKISRMIAKILVQKGATRIRITNRTDATAAQLAALTGATPIPFSQFRDNLPSCDVLFCASSAPHSLISEAVLREAMNERKRPLVIVDIAMPPDVEQGAMTIPGVLYYGLEEVRAYVRNAESSRIEEVPLVERIVEEEQHAYRNELYIRERKGAIRSISKYIEDIRLQELERLSARNEITSDDIDAFSRSVLKKAFHTLFQNFQDSSCPPELVHAARELILVPYKKRSE